MTTRSLAQVGATIAEDRLSPLGRFAGFDYARFDGRELEIEIRPSNAGDYNFHVGEVVVSRKVVEDDGRSVSLQQHRGWIVDLGTYARKVEAKARDAARAARSRERYRVANLERLVTLAARHPLTAADIERSFSDSWPTPVDPEQARALRQRIAAYARALQAVSEAATGAYASRVTRREADGRLTNRTDTAA